MKRSSLTSMVIIIFTSCKVQVSIYGAMFTVFLESYMSLSLTSLQYGL